MSENETHELAMTGAVRVDSLASLRPSFEAAAAGAGPVELDLDGLEHLDGAALQFLLSFVRTMQQAGRPLTIQGAVAPRVLETAARVGADEHLPFARPEAGA